MDSDDLDRLRWLKNYYDEWLGQYQTAARIVPWIQESRAFVEWEIEARSQRPEEAQEIVYPRVSDTVTWTPEQIQSALPRLPEIDPQRVRDAMVITTAGTVTMYPYVRRVGEIIPTPEAQEYAVTYAQQYQQLQKTYGRLDEVRKLIAKLNNPSTSARFESAQRAYASGKATAMPRTAAANEIRNLLEGVQGDLWERARRPQDQKVDWEIIASRLAKGGVDSPGYAEIRTQGSRRRILFEELSAVTKDREGKTLFNLDDIWTQVLDHLYVVLNLIEV